MLSSPMNCCVIEGNKFVLIFLILACGWKLSLNQLNDCIVDEVICPRCDKNQFGVDCLSCNCDPFGSLKSCDPVSGECYCRRGVTGRRCNICSRQGSLGPSITANQAACLQCFCNGYSNSCTSADSWFMASVSNYFNLEDVTGNWMENNGGRITWEEEGFMRVEGVAGRAELLFPAEYLGDKKTSFGQQFLVTLRQSPAQDSKATVTVRISTTAVNPYDYGLQLEMSPVAISNSWKTIKVIDQMLVSGGVVASEDQLRRVLANISDITLVAVGDGDITIDILTVHLDYATPTVLANGIADYVEMCQCPPGRHGQFCEDCSLGYARDPPNGGPFAACVKCYCSNKTTSCDPETGRCHNCTNNTSGDHCEHCTDGYYRNTTTGECLPCSCPGQLGGDNYFATSCVAIDNHNIGCSCKAGYEGTVCDECANGYYRNGSCVACHCEEATTVRCDRVTGKCTCSPGVTGQFCEVCEPGTTNLWPNCLACNNECHNLWNNSLFRLTETVNGSISMVTSLNASSINVTVMNHYLYGLIDDIVAIVNNSNLNISQLNSVIRLVAMVTEQVTTQLQLGNTIEDNMVSINRSEMMLLQQLERISEQLTDSLTELDNLELELAVDNGTDLVAIVTQSLNRSSAAYRVISNEVTLTIATITNSSSDYQSKIDSFQPIENQLNELLLVIDNVTTFATTVNRFLCGQCDLQDDCGLKCEGILNRSIATANQIETSIQIIDSHLNTTNTIKDELQKFLHTVNSTLALLNTTEDLDLLNQTNLQLDLLNQLHNLTSDLLDRLNVSTLLLIEAMVNQSLMYQLSLTPSEVANLITSINVIITEFPLLHDSSDIIKEINNTLILAMDSYRRGQEVANDAKSATSDLEELMDLHSNITSRTDRAERNSTLLQTNINKTRHDIKQGEETLQMVHAALMSLNETIRSTNSTVDNNNRLANLLDKRITNITNTASNNSNEWKQTGRAVDELATNASNQASMSETIRRQSDQLLAEINQLLNITRIQQDIVNDLEETYTQQYFRHCSVVDDVRSVHITLEGLISDINRITTINSFCVKSNCC